MRRNGCRILDPNAPDRLAVTRFVPVNRYEAAQFDLPQRSRIFGGNVDARYDIAAPRLPIMRRSRWLYQNSPTVAGLVESLVAYVIGSGLYPAAASSDSAWNEQAQEEWRLFAQNPELRTRISWATYQRICVRGIFVDGEFFTQLSSGDSGFPRIVMIESHRVRTPDDLSRDPANRAPDGIKLGRYGRVAKWYVPTRDERTGKETVHTVNAERMVQSWFPIRPEQYRGITMFAAALNTAHDLDDILSYEKQSVKRMSSRTDVVKTQAGELDPQELLRGNVSTDSCDPKVREYYQSVIGSETMVLRAGDEYQGLESDRPSASWQGFVDFLVQSVCQTTGLPHNVVIPTKMGGADSRRDLARAARVFEQWQDELVAGWTRIYRYVVEDARVNGRLPDGPADWMKVSWQYPKSITVDYGREAEQDREDVRAGLLSLEEYFSRYGMEWRDQLRQLQIESDAVKALGDDVWERVYAAPGSQQSTGDNRDGSN